MKKLLTALFVLALSVSALFAAGPQKGNLALGAGWGAIAEPATFDTVRDQGLVYSLEFWPIREFSLLAQRTQFQTGYDLYTISVAPKLWVFEIPYGLTFIPTAHAKDVYGIHAGLAYNLWDEGFMGVQLGARYHRFVEGEVDGSDRAIEATAVVRVKFGSK